MPGLKSADQPVLGEKLIISRRNASVSEWTRPRILKIKTSRDTKRLFGRILYPLFNLLSFLFLLTISRPPRGYVKTKKLLHTLDRRVATRTLIQNPTACAAPAEPKQQLELGREPDPPTCDAVSSAQSS